MNSLSLSIPHPRDCPSTSDIQLCKAAIEELDQRIQRLKSSRRPNLSRIEEYERNKRNHLSYISPFRCLPVEILNEIFGLSLWNDANIVALSQVCCRFREIILDMASLWSH